MNKSYKVKHLKLSKMFLGSVVLGIVPALIQLVLLTIGTVSTGSLLQNILPIFIYCAFMPIAIGIAGVIIGTVYNWLSPKIGQFEVELEEIE